MCARVVVGELAPTCAGELAERRAADRDDDQVAVERYACALSVTGPRRSIRRDQGALEPELAGGSAAPRRPSSRRGRGTPRSLHAPPDGRGAARCADRRPPARRRRRRAGRARRHSLGVGGRTTARRPGAHAVEPHQPLRGRAQHHARQVVVAEHQRLLDAAGGEHHGLGAQLVQPVALDHGQPVVGEQAVAGGVGHHADVAAARRRARGSSVGSVAAALAGRIEARIGQRAAELPRSSSIRITSAPASRGLAPPPARPARRRSPPRRRTDTPCRSSRDGRRCSPRPGRPCARMSGSQHFQAPFGR